MADYRWTGTTSGDLSVSTNFAPNGTPGNGDTLLFIDGANSVTSGTNTFDANTGMKVKVGRDFSAKLGSSGSPLQFSTGTELTFDGTLCKGAYFDIETCTQAVIEEGRNMADTLVLEAGTYSDLIVRNAINVTLGGSITVTQLESIGSCEVRTEAGCTVTTTYWGGGTLLSYNTMGTIHQTGGQIDLAGDASNSDVTLLNIWGENALFNWNAQGGTITAANVYKGKFDASSSAFARTLTDSSVHGGGILILDNGVDSIAATNNPKVRGGVLIAGESITGDYEAPTPRIAM